MADDENKDAVPATPTPAAAPEPEPNPWAPLIAAGAKFLEAAAATVGRLGQVAAEEGERLVQGGGAAAGKKITKFVDGVLAPLEGEPKPKKPKAP